MINEENNPTKQDTGRGGLFIRRIVPMDKCVQIDWELLGPNALPIDTFVIMIRCIEEDTKISLHDPCRIFCMPSDARSIKVDGMFNGVDYAVTIGAFRENMETARSCTRLFRTGPTVGTVVAYLHPQDFTFNSSGRSVASPSLIRLPGGRLLASHDIHWSKGGQNITHIYASDDDGASWFFLSELKPCFWGKMFINYQALYMLCISTEYGDLQIYRSDDMGETFTGPFILLKGSDRQGARGPHKAPVPIVRHKGRLWTAVEYGRWSMGGHNTGVISVPDDADLCDPTNWTLSPFVSYNPEWPGVVRGGRPSVVEGNVVVTPDGGLVNILRYQTEGAIPEYGKAIMMHIDDEHPDAPQTFKACINFPGNLSKFDICRDEQTGIYISLVNRGHLPWYGQRNILSLSVSDNLTDWRIVEDLINYEDKEWPEGALKVGFQYVDFFIEGSSLYYLSRTAVNGAWSFHNANYITFHKLYHADSLASEIIKR